MRGVRSAADVPVSRAMLHGVRDELRARIDGTNARIDETNARISGMRSEVLAEVHRLGTLIEEQEVRNRVVIEVVQGHNARFDRLEGTIEEMRGMFREIVDLLRQRPGG